MSEIGEYSPTVLHKDAKEGYAGKEFTEEQKEKLTQEGYKVYRLTGKSFKELTSGVRADGHLNNYRLDLSSEWHYGLEGFDTLRSNQTEVAVQFYRQRFDSADVLTTLPAETPFSDEELSSLTAMRERLRDDWNNQLTVAQQNALLQEYSNEIASKIPGTKAIMGNLADYIDLIIAIRQGRVSYDDEVIKGVIRANFKKRSNICLSQTAGVHFFRLDRGVSPTATTHTKIVPLVVPE